MRGLKLRQVETFCELARQGALAPTAERLSLTQSAVSLSVRELERQLGETLFNKQGRKLVLSDRGRELLPVAQELLERAESFGESGKHLSRQHLAIGATRSIGPHVLAQLINDFEHHQADGPRHHYELFIQNTEAVLTRLAARTLDLAFVEGDVPAPDLHKKVWLQDHLVIFCRAGHPLLARRQKLVALGQASWALREPGSGTRETFLRAVAPLMPALSIDLEATDNATLAEAVARSDRVGCLSRRAIAGDLDSGRLIEIKAAVLDPDGGLDRRLSRHFWLVRHPQRFQRQIVSEFLDFAQTWSQI